MAFEIFVSPSVITREIDASFVPAGVASIVGTAIGLTKKGPAFVPTRINTFSEFEARFGTLDPDLYTPYAIRSYMRNASSVYVIRILGKESVTLGPAAQVAFPATGTEALGSVTGASGSTNIVFATLRSRSSTPTILSYTGNYSSCTLFDGANYATVSFDSTTENYIKKVLGTDPETVYLGDALTAWYVDAVFDYASASPITATGSITGTLTTTSGTFAATGYNRTIGSGYTHGYTPIIVSQNFGGSVYQLFKLHALSDGTQSNYDIKISITNVQTLDNVTGDPLEFPKFDILVRDYWDSDRKPVIYETFSQVTLDPTDKNFIARVIGNKYQIVDTTQNPPEIIDMGEYDIKSKYIRVEVFNGYPATARPSGFKGIDKGASPKVIPAIPYKKDHLDHNNDVSDNIFMGVDFLNYVDTGVSDRIKPTVTEIDAAGGYTNSADSGLLVFATTGENYNSVTGTSLTATYSILNLSTSATNSLSATCQIGQIRLTVPMFGGWNGYTPETPEKTLQCGGSLTSAYWDAAKIISNTRQFDTNLVVTPGINSSTPGFICEKILEVVEGRGDCFYIIDLAPTTAVDSGLSATITNMVNEAQKYDSSYAGSYYPWLQINDPENDRDVWVPPSVEVFGAYAFNDRVAQPWSAVAGFNRAALSTVKNVRKRITTSHSDTLYLGKVNPIVSFANEGIVIYGQKTLQNKASALDRINVRRLMLEIRKVIASMAKYVVFEPNDPQTRQGLVAVIKPYLERVQQLRGINDFRIVLDDTTTTPDLIERNQMYGKIFIKPTQTAEFILIDFILTRQGANFSA